MDAATRKPSPAERSLVPALAGLVVFLALLSLGIGAVPLSPGEVLQVLVGQASQATTIIVGEIRLPRALLAVMVGATLGLSGAALQGLLRNPLAEPALFGAPASAAFAAVVTIGLGIADALSFALPIAAMAGALLSVVLLVAVAGREASLLVVLLAGLAVSSLAGALTALALNLAPNPFAALEIAFWLLGSLEDRSLQHVLIALPLTSLSWVLLFADARALRALTLGEDVAASLGVDLTRTRLRIVFGVAAGTGAAVAVSGAMAFVGLVAPHLVRALARHDPGRLLLPAALAGAALLLAADILVRVIPSSSPIRLGVVTALIGAPVFIAMVFRRRRELSGAQP
ncbi:MAG: iron ABC transporter permease [Bauldia sp.]